MQGPGLSVGLDLGKRVLDGMVGGWWFGSLLLNYATAGKLCMRSGGLKVCQQSGSCLQKRSAKAAVVD